MLVIDWDKINNLYREGVTIRQLSDKFSIKKKTIYKNLNKLYPESKQIHKNIRRELKIISKKESKLYMSDSEVIRLNRSIYKTCKEDGNIYLDTSNSVPIDVPRLCRNCKSELKRKKLDIRILRLKKGDKVSLEYIDDELFELSKYRVLDRINRHRVICEGYLKHKVLSGYIVVYFKKIESENCNVVEIKEIKIKNLLN